MAEQQGLVHIYYGDGKGKTTAAFGLAFRCAGWGKRAVIAQFLKSSPCGEVTAAERFPELTVLRSKGIHKFTFQMDEAEKASTAAECAALFQQAVELAQAREARLLVLDEVIDAVRGFLSLEAGDHVNAGQVLGTVGDTAIAESALASHLHFAMALDGAAVDPGEYLPE